jgi:hypothetical protein
MKITQFLLAAALVGVLAVSASVIAAPVDSVESSRASAAKQKLDAFLGEKLVVDQMRSLGITRAHVTARLAQLSDTQIEQLAAQADLLQTGGTIQKSFPNPVGPLELNPARPVSHLFEQFRIFFKHLFEAFFAWRE